MRSNDEAYLKALETLCIELKAEGGYSYEPIRAARVLRVTTEGVWLDMMTMSTPYDRDEAMQTVFPAPKPSSPVTSVPTAYDLISVRARCAQEFHPGRYARHPARLAHPDGPEAAM